MIIKGKATCEKCKKTVETAFSDKAKINDVVGYCEDCNWTLKVSHIPILHDKLMKMPTIIVGMN